MTYVPENDHIDRLVQSERDYAAAIVDAIAVHGLEHRELYIDAILELPRRYFDDGVGMSDWVRYGLKPQDLDGEDVVVPPMAIKATHEMLDGMLSGANAILEAHAGGGQ